MDQGLNLENLKLHCRTCLTRLKGTRYNTSELTHSLFKLFEECAGYGIYDKDIYPECICFRCYWRLKSFEDFHVLCQKSTDTLKKLLQSTDIVVCKIEEHIEEIYEKNTVQTKGYQAPSCKEKTVTDEITLNGKGELNVSFLDKIEVNEQIEDSEELINYFPRVAKNEEERSNNSAPVKSNEEKALYKIRNQIHNCKICQGKFSCVSSYKLHMLTHLKKPTFQCEQNILGFDIKYHLKKHNICKRKETDKAQYGKKNAFIAQATSRDNDSITESQENLESNQLNQFSDDDVKGVENFNFPTAISSTTCKVCFQTCSSKNSLRIHMRTHLSKRPFQCNKCDRNFNVKAVLNSHIREVHAEVPLQIECKYGCGKVFHRSGTAETHYRLKHILPAKGITPKDRSRICEDCGKVCRNISYLKEHKYQHTPLEECPYYCQICDRRFRSKKVMSRHLERHEPIRKYECPHCGLKKATRQDLVMHINGHTKEKKYPCPICSKIFYHAENLRRHKLAVHLGIKKYKCRFCEQSFGKSEERAQHEEQHKSK